MKILAIETSCDETAVAVLECSGPVERPSITVLSQALYSQVDTHAPYGGVFPALAKREHVKNLAPLTLQALKEAEVAYEANSQQPRRLRRRSRVGAPTEASGLTANSCKEILHREKQLADALIEHIFPLGTPDIDAIAVTQGPGLEPALWVGLNFAKALSYAWNIPLVPTNHMEGHIASVLVDRGGPKHQASNSKESSISSPRPPEPVRYPALALLVSGGHTELVRMTAPLSYERIGETRDDAVGEAYDKVARLLGLPYPGGPEISKLANKFRDKHQIPKTKLQTNSKRETQNPKHSFVFPRPMIDSDDYDFSFSGLKTAVLYKIKEMGELTDEIKATIAYEFEEAAIDSLIAKTKKAIEAEETQTLIAGGGVIANSQLRERLAMLAETHGTRFLVPGHGLSTDNAIMIGAAAYLHLANGETYEPYDPADELRADGTLKLGVRV